MEDVKITTAKVSKSYMYEVDNALRLEDGRIYTTKTPWENSRPSGFPEKIDVTEEVLNIICDGLKRRGW